MLSRADAVAFPSGDLDTTRRSAACLATIAEKYGTPAHVLTLARLEDNYTGLRRALEQVAVPVQILYSVKTNYMPLVLSRLHALGAGADVVSGVELELALRIGFAPDKVVFNGPCKSAAELERAAAAGVFINIDGLEEAGHLQGFAERNRTTIAVGLRVNPGMNVYLSEDQTFNIQSEHRARESKFGWTIGDGAAQRAAQAICAHKRLELVGLQCHLGSQITDCSAFTAALDEMFALAAQLRARHPIQRLNVGGGFGVPGIRRERSGPLRQLMALYGRDGPFDQSASLDLQTFCASVNRSLRRYGLSDAGLFCEPGRFIVSNAMRLLTRVASVKKTGGVDWVILDAGLNLMPTIALNEDHRMMTVRSSNARRKVYRVGGPLCYEGDVLSPGKEFPGDIAAGDLILIEDSGAYTVSRATNFIQPRAPVVAVDGERIELCWRRETYDDVFAYHCPSTFDAVGSGPA